MIKELSMPFEGSGGKTKSCRPKSWGGMGEGRGILHSEQISHTYDFGNKNVKDAGLRTPLPDIAAKSQSKLSKVKLIFSPANENSRGYVTGITANRKPESRIDTQNGINGGKSVVHANLRWRGVNPGQS